MAKCYWVSRSEVHDSEGYKRYIEIATPAFERSGAKYLARGGKVEALMGEARPRNILAEFPSMEAAREFFNSPEYTEALNSLVPPFPLGKTKSWADTLSRLAMVCSFPDFMLAFFFSMSR